MNSYIKQCLKPILGDDVSDDIVEYLSTIKHEEDFAEFMENIIDMSNPEHVQVYYSLKSHQFGEAIKKNTAKESTIANKSNKQIDKSKGNKKDRFNDGREILYEYRKQDFNEHQRSDNKKSNPSTPSQSNLSAESNSGGKGKKVKYTNFYTQDHKPGLRKGRYPCDCQATKHDLINNCLSCGRIVCEQEGSGPCFFCDNMVCTRGEMEILQQNSKKSDKLYNQLMEKKKSAEWKKAIETRNRLIKTDQQGDEIKNKVYDDQNDYFDVNSQWLSESDKSNMKKRQSASYNRFHKSKRDFKIALDFASRTVYVDDEQPKYKDNLMKSVNKLLDSTEKRFPRNLFEGEKGELIAEIVKLMEEQSLSDTPVKEEKSKPISNENKNNTKKFRVANNELLESLDQGMCLSMHQPWASLLVAGIKIHEGRTWRTDHRGRLWIAAAAKEPQDDEILACEEMYRVLYNDSALTFPKKYPTGCLLGCVFVEDCLDQSEYKRKYPNGESESPFVLICSNPVILPVFYPMQGQHKIFPLNKELHKTAKAALMSSKWI